MSAAEFFAEPDDQVVVHSHPRAFAEGLLAAAGSAAIWNVAAQGIQPLGGAILSGEPYGDAQRHGARSRASSSAAFMSSVATPRRRNGPATAIW
jgi:hypothetical protein